MSEEKLHYLVGIGVSVETFARKVRERSNGAEITSLEMWKVPGLPLACSRMRTQSQPSPSIRPQVLPTHPIGAIGNPYGPGVNPYGSGPGSQIAYLPGAMPTTGIQAQSEMASPGPGHYTSPPAYGDPRNFPPPQPAVPGQEPVRYYPAAPGSGSPFGGVTASNIHLLFGASSGQAHFVKPTPPNQSRESDHSQDLQRPDRREKRRQKS